MMHHSAQPSANGLWQSNRGPLPGTKPRASVVAVYVEAGVEAIPPIGVTVVERPAPQPVAFGGVVIRTVAKGHAIQQVRLPMPMPMMVWRLSMPREKKESAAGLALVIVPVVVVKMLQPLRGPLRRWREWR
jgi:hypothetical protein